MVDAKEAAQRLAISRDRNNGNGMIERERWYVTAKCQNRPDKGRRLHGGVGLRVGINRGHR